MIPPQTAEGPPPATAKPIAKAGILAEATASLAPFHTRFAHRPDWQVAADDEAAVQRDSRTGG